MHASNNKRLSGKKAFVTGGSRGIGAAIVDRLAEEGADVAFTYRGRRDAARKVSNKIQGSAAHGLAIQADSGDPTALVKAIEEAADKLGRIDIFVSSAGTLLFKPFETLLRLTCALLMSDRRLCSATWEREDGSFSFRAISPTTQPFL